MKTSTVRKFMLSFLVIIAAPVCHGFTYGQFAGFSGYQEYEVGDGVYFVAFHVQRGTDADGLDLAWRARASEICLARSAPYFMELKHSLEPVLKIEKSGNLDRDLSNAERFVQTAGFIYIPIFIPSGGGGGLIESPTKQAHVRCISNEIDVKDSSRLVNAGNILAEARTKKWFQRK